MTRKLIIFTFYRETEKYVIIQENQGAQEVTKYGRYAVKHFISQHNR